jgi:hypothetical protein
VLQGSLDYVFGEYRVWMAGGGVKGGMAYGETDDFCYNIAKDPVHIHDFNATILRTLESITNVLSLTSIPTRAILIASMGVSLLDNLDLEAVAPTC